MPNTPQDYIDQLSQCGTLNYQAMAAFISDALGGSSTSNKQEILSDDIRIISNADDGIIILKMTGTLAPFVAAGEATVKFIRIFPANPPDQPNEETQWLSSVQPKYIIYDSVPAVMFETIDSDIITNQTFKIIVTI